MRTRVYTHEECHLAPDAMVTASSHDEVSYCGEAVAQCGRPNYIHEVKAILAAVNANAEDEPVVV